MIEAIVLAAGKGERMGAVKPLVMIDGEAVLTRVIAVLKTAGVERIVVVLGHAQEQVRAEVNLEECTVVVNNAYETGMASSLRSGLEAVMEQADGFLIAHADMPYIEEETIRTILDRARAGARIVAPSYRGTRGFPVYLDASYKPDLYPTLIGDVGARDFIAMHARELVLIEVTDPGVVTDIDRPQDVVGRGGA